MTRPPGDRAANHGGVGWVEPAPGPSLVDSKRYRKLLDDVTAGRAKVEPPLPAFALPITCDCCGEAGPTVKHRERTGGPDGNLCDSCEHDADLAGAESPQF